MITDHKLAIDFLATWLADYAKQNHRKGFVIVHSDNLADTVLNYVCVEATKKHGGLSVNCVELDDTTYDVWVREHAIADRIGGIVVGPIDRSHGLYARYFGKVREGLYAILSGIKNYRSFVWSVPMICPSEKPLRFQAER